MIQRRFLLQYSCRFLAYYRVRRELFSFHYNFYGTTTKFDFGVAFSVAVAVTCTVLPASYTVRHSLWTICANSWRTSYQARMLCGAAHLRYFRCLLSVAPLLALQAGASAAASCTPI